MIWSVCACLFKTCDSFPKPPEIIFKSCIERGQFSNDLKKGNVVAIHKKCDKKWTKTSALFHYLRYAAKYFIRVYYIIIYFKFSLKMITLLISNH